MDITDYTRKDIGNLGEKVAIEYLRKHGFTLIDRNVARKTGEIDVIVKKDDTLHLVEVKTLVCNEFPGARLSKDEYDPSANLHPLKIAKITLLLRTVRCSLILPLGGALLEKALPAPPKPGRRSVPLCSMYHGRLARDLRFRNTGVSPVISDSVHGR